MGTRGSNEITCNPEKNLLTCKENHVGQDQFIKIKTQITIVLDQCRD